VPAPAVSLPWELSLEHRFAAEALISAAGARVTANDGPQVRLAERDLDIAFHHLVRAEEAGGNADAHGRYPGRASSLRKDPHPVDDLLPAVRKAIAKAGVEPAPRWPGGARFFVALTHDIDTPWRWTRGGVRGAAARLKRAALTLHLGDALVEARGLARVPLHRLRGTDPNWSFARVAELEADRGWLSTSYLLAAHRDPHDGARPDVYDRLRPRLVQELRDLGGEIGLHGSYRSSEDEGMLRSELHDLAALTGDPVRGLRFHYLRMRWLDVVERIEHVGLAYDTSLGFADRPGPRTGLSFPFVPWAARAGRPATFLELPLVLMDATLAERRYMGLSARAARKEIDRALDHLAAVGGGAAVLWHNDRFDRVHGRGWDGAYEHLLDGIARRGGTAGTAAALHDWWRAERCAS
jgi:hypothetical protein